MFRRLWKHGFQSVKRKPSTASLLIVSTCAIENSESISSNLKPLKLLTREEMTHEALIRQACTVSANSSSQLLTQVLMAIHDTSKTYREAISELVVLLEESILLVTNSNKMTVDQVEELIVQQRNFVEEKRLLLQELISLMDYVEKMVTATAETAYLAGAEHSSTLMCERLNSALNKVLEEKVSNKKSEDELLNIQAAYVIKLGEFSEKDKHRFNETVSQDADIGDEKYENSK